tara:strand:- start:1412 stop:2476 length:1065 start_codon:yes stop_codon:yes gene_type:complete
MDKKIQQLADIFTKHSIIIKEGDYIVVKYGYEARKLALACFKNILKQKAIPVMVCADDIFTYPYYQLASEEQLKTVPLFMETEAKKASGWISIHCDNNTRILSNVDPDKVTTRRKAIMPLNDIIIDKDNWVLFLWPTNALAQDADMSLEEFTDFVFDASLVDWKKAEEEQSKLKKVLDEGKEVHIIGKNTDLKFSIEGRQGLKCFGKRNMPDGEVFIAPVEDTTEGTIEYSFPGIYGGREVSGITLTFEKGKVVKATAEKNEEYLKKMLDMDEGAKFLGECGIGTNYNITKFVKQILFDEKIGGTVHLALGRAYKEGNGKNESALHWDMIKDLREGGKILVDGKVIQEKGKFMI